MTTEPGTSDDARQITRAVLDAWRSGVDAHDPEAVAALFADDAVFQGLRPEHGVGRAAVSAYYASQPAGMTAGYDVLSSRALAPDVVLAFARAAFGFTDGAQTLVHLTVVLDRVDASRRIRHYHVSRIG